MGPARQYHLHTDCTYGHHTNTLRGNCSNKTILAHVIVNNGPKNENGEWKSRTNPELEAISKGENIVKWIKGQRIS